MATARKCANPAFKLTKMIRDMRLGSECCRFRSGTTTDAPYANAKLPNVVRTWCGTGKIWWHGQRTNFKETAYHGENVGIFLASKPSAPPHLL
ncbi:hypothetical protein CCR75_006783 [Bremia lactucae]|uniref:Uncharacterized protein n=1 Tax=Bremia lactucae TaxID=4779 RepID=A0A976IDK7_BRELC|nr:hypothetical protein CCR75_006783 [Bremia lactucae]